MVTKSIEKSFDFGLKLEKNLLVVIGKKLAPISTSFALSLIDLGE